MKTAKSKSGFVPYLVTKMKMLKIVAEAKC